MLEKKTIQSLQARNSTRQSSVLHRSDCRLLPPSASLETPQPFCLKPCSSCYPKVSGPQFSRLSATTMLLLLLLLAFTWCGASETTLLKRLERWDHSLCTDQCRRDAFVSEYVPQLHYLHFSPSDARDTDGGRSAPATPPNCILLMCCFYACPSCNASTKIDSTVGGVRVPSLQRHRSVKQS